LKTVQVVTKVQQKRSEKRFSSDFLIVKIVVKIAVYAGRKQLANGNWQLAFANGSRHCCQNWNRYPIRSDISEDNSTYVRM
jgi:hypothetical protein